jgi:DNA (cytosine-5)-methyltransferase 1
MVAFNTNMEGYTRAKFLLTEGIEVVAGGFPCQDISAAGKGAGLAGSRSGLWREMVRTIRLVRPIYAIVENVAMLLNRGMGTVLGDLAESGYDTEWGCISAKDVGAPHLRERIWVIAHTEQPGRQYRKKSDTAGIKERQPRTHTNDTVSQGLSANNRGERRKGEFPRQIQRQPEFSWCEDVRRLEDYFNRSDIPEPLVCRGGNGVSARLHGLGNSVIPAIPRILGESIK